MQNVCLKGIREVIRFEALAELADELLHRFGIARLDTSFNPRRSQNKQVLGFRDAPTISGIHVLITQRTVRVMRFFNTLRDISALWSSHTVDHGRKAPRGCIRSHWQRGIRRSVHSSIPRIKGIPGHARHAKGYPWPLHRTREEWQFRQSPSRLDRPGNH